LAIFREDNVICLVDMEHEQATHARSPHQAHVEDIQRRLEETPHDRCVVRRYTDVTQSWLDRGGIGALILSGNVTDWHVYDQADLRPLTMIVQDAYLCEVKSVPDGFELLTSTDVCRIQALCRAGTLVYGTQFHPEDYIVRPADQHNWLIDMVYPTGYTHGQPDGRQLLRDFFPAARVLPS